MTQLNKEKWSATTLRPQNNNITTQRKASPEASSYANVVNMRRVLIFPSNYWHESEYAYFPKCQTILFTAWKTLAEKLFREMSTGTDKESEDKVNND